MQEQLVPPRQHGASWRESEYRLIAADLRAGVEVEKIAIELGRTPSAVHTALRNFIPPSEKVRRKDVPGWIRDRLNAEPDWDWWSVIVEHYAHGPSPLWLTSHEHIARAAWRERTPMPVLAQRLHTAEIAVAEFLRALGLAENIVEVADRLGATPGGALAKRVQAARDHAITTAWILVVENAEGTVKPRSAPGRRHISVHESRAAAEAARDRVLRWHRRHAGESTNPVSWTIAQRGVGDMAGRTYAGVHRPSSDGVRAGALVVGDRIRITGAAGSLDAIVQSINHRDDVVIVDLGPIDESRVRRTIEFAPDELVDIQQ